MFSGDGLDSGKIFFGIISNDRIYFKTNEKTHGRYIKERMKPFAPSKTQILKNYYEVPIEVIENREQILDWAEEAINVSTEK